MAKRLRKDTDGLYVLTSVDPHPSGLSSAKPKETALIILTQDDLDAILADHAAGVEPVPSETSDTSKSMGLSNAQKVEDAPLRTDGPTLEEYVKSGYLAENYPPAGYAAKE